jgi:hypothetical protein
MTRHNLASHISWLLSNENTPPVGVPAIASNHSTVAAEVSYAGLAEEDTNQPIPRASINPPVAQSVNVGQGFQRPALPSTDSQNPRVRDQTKSVVEESMGRLSSTSRSTRPGLVIQNQLATPASTTGSSSLTQGYATFLRASNGEFKAVRLLHIPPTDLCRHAIFKARRATAIEYHKTRANTTDAQTDTPSDVKAQTRQCRIGGSYWG